KYYLWMHAHGSVDPARSYLDTWSRRHRTFAGLTAGLSNTPASQQQFTAWLERYISGVTGVKVHSVCVLKKQVRFDAGGLPEELASDTVLSIH
ncbi:MAG TPA: hypothetical protein VGR89_09945, partial [Puia sp.]|nr:hypothetical protein [Puia sp.]